MSAKAIISPIFLKIELNNGGQTDAHQPHTALLEFYCGSIKIVHKYFLQGFEHVRKYNLLDALLLP